MNLIIKFLSKGKNISTISGDLIFNNVSFSYNENEKVIDKLNITVKKDTLNALCGPSGSGKSTIADLLLGLYKPTSGDILLDNNSIYDFDIKSWRNRIGFVSQDNFLFHGTILEKIRVGSPDISLEKVIDCSKKAQSYNFINNFPNKFETIVGDRGLLLSGGQKQRIAIIRALIRNPDLLIFDEATSALDALNEEKIMDLIFNLSDTNSSHNYAQA